MNNPANHKETYFLVTYKDPEKLIENKNLSIKVKTIKDSNLGLCFICLSDFIFQRSDSLIVAPNEEKIRKRFEHTKSFHLSIYNVISIEEIGIENQGLTFKNDKSNLFVLPKDRPTDQH